MKIEAREMCLNEIELMVDYFLNAEAAFLEKMGVDRAKLPEREQWIKKLQLDIVKPFNERAFFYVVWLMDNEPIGHSNINNIVFGSSATMHLHVWKNEKRKSGLGLHFLQKTIPLYFKYFDLKELICEPRAANIAPNKTLLKLGFEFLKTYETTPGWINFHQTVSRYRLLKENLE
ncbi:GNAT family N-acetyltransferase [Aquimarina rhabdastrellae]